jgi:hypothetical protein
LPPETCTSCPLQLVWKWRGASTGGVTNWTVYYGYTRSNTITTGTASDIFSNLAGAPTTGPNEQNVSVTSPSTGTVTTNKIYTCSVNCDISAMILDRNSSEDNSTGDTFWFSIVRNATSGTDTNTGEAQVFTMSAAIRKWCAGSYEALNA